MLYAACPHACGLAQRFSRQDFLTLHVIDRLQRLQRQGDMVTATLFRNQRCQDQPAVPALQAVPPKTAKPLSNAPVMPQCLLHQKKKASGLFPSKTWGAPMEATGPMDPRMSITPATATAMRNQCAAARPISDRLSTGRLLGLFCESRAAPASPPQKPVRRRQGRSVHQAAMASPRRRCR